MELERNIALSRCSRSKRPFIGHTIPANQLNLLSTACAIILRASTMTISNYTPHQNFTRMATHTLLSRNFNSINTADSMSKSISTNPFSHPLDIIIEFQSKGDHIKMREYIYFWCTFPRNSTMIENVLRSPLIATNSSKRVPPEEERDLLLSYL